MATRKPKADTNEYPFTSQEGHTVTGRVIIETPTARKPRKFMYNTICKHCLSETLMDSDQLKGSRAKKSCGCNLSKDLSHPTHGLRNSPEYAVYYAMRSRCTKPTNKSYENYGGRGIKVCDRWMESFENFIEDMGQRPTDKHTLEREDNDKGYESTNCKWLIRADQNYNTRSFKDAKHIYKTRTGSYYVKIGSTDFGTHKTLSKAEKIRRH